MKKSIVISLLTIALIFSTAICSFAATGIVTTDTLRLREDASVNASIIGLLYQDEEVQILEEKDGWYKVKSGNQVGYVSAEYVKNLQETVTTNPVENQVEEEKNDTITNEETNVVEVNTENQENKTTTKSIIAGTKIYVTPVINSIILNTVSEETEIESISEVSEWTYINTANIKGWVRTENIVQKEVSIPETNNENNNTSSQKQVGYISATSVNFREEASTSSNIIQELVRNTEVTIIENVNGWAKIEYNGRVGYISADYISNSKTQTTSRNSVDRTAKTSTTNKTTQTESKTESTNTSSNVTGAEIVAFAKQYVGYKYVYGGASPSGFDCSGFTQYVYKHFGYSLNRTAADQRLNGKAVSKDSMQEGDVICFSGSSGSKSVTHVGIYIGGGKFVHAANSRRGVIISNVTGDGFYFVCARRII